MNQVQSIACSLCISGFPDDAFQVVDFSGEEGISKPYSFTLTLMSMDAAVSPSKARGKGAVFTIEAATGSNSFHAMIFSFKRIRSLEGVAFYRCVIGPKLAILGLSQHSQVFLDQTIPQIIESTLHQCGVKETEFRLQTSYPQEEYVCQFNETFLNFISRWMEKLGIYYFFESSKSGEKLIITDTKIAHTPVSEKKFQYLLQSNLDVSERNLKIFDMELESSIIPESMTLKDYNYMHPSTNLEAKTSVFEEGMGEAYHYGDHYLTAQQGEALAKIRAEERLCEETLAHGESTVPLFRSGFYMSVQGHPMDEVNATFLLTSVRHQGRQNLPQAAGLTDRLYPGEAEDSYRNVFTALPSNRQFRPARRARMRRFHGVISAFIDASGSGEYAQLDEYGRYKVILPWDLAQHPPGKASAFLRLAEPYAGPYYGMHFPLHKGTEVLLSFIDGNPDRPLISGSVHNAENRNMINNQEEPYSVIKTAANNQTLWGDEKGKECMCLSSPVANSSVSLGTTSNGKQGIAETTDGQYLRFSTDASTEVTMGSSNEVVIGQKGEFACGASFEISAGAKAGCVVGSEVAWNFGGKAEIGSEAVEIHEERTIASFTSLNLSGGTNSAFKESLQSLQKIWAALVAANVTAALAMGLQNHCGQGLSKPWEISVTSLEAAAAVALGIKLSKDINEAGDKLEEADKAGQITLDEHGITGYANNTVDFPNATVQFTVRDDTKASTSSNSFKMTQPRATPDYNYIQIENKLAANTASMKFTKGETIAITAPGASVNMTGSVDAAKIEIAAKGTDPNPMQLTVNPAECSVSCGTTPFKIARAGDSANITLQSGKTECDIYPTAVGIKTTFLTFNAKQTSIRGDVIKLGE